MRTWKRLGLVVGGLLTLEAATYLGFLLAVFANIACLVGTDANEDFGI